MGFCFKTTLVVAHFLFVSGLVGASQYVYPSILALIGEFYQINERTQAFLVSIPSISLVPSIILVSFFTSRFGLRASIRIGLVIITISSLFRLIAAFDPAFFVLVVLGQTFLGIGLPFVTFSVVPLFSNTYFSSNHRGKMNSVALFTNQLFGGIMSALCPIFSTQTDDTGSTVLVLSSLRAILICLFILSSLLMISSFFLKFESKQTNYANSFTEWLYSFSALFKNLQFYLILIPVAVNFGLISSFMALINSFTSKLGYTEKQAGLFGAGVLISGIVGSLVGGLVTDFFERRKKDASYAIKANGVLLAIFAVLLGVALKPDSFLFIFLVLLFEGASSMAIMPLTSELIVETTHPINPATSSGVLYMLGSLLTFGFTNIFQEISLVDEYVSIWVFSGVFVFAMGILMFYFCPYKRRKSQENQEQSSLLNLVSACKY